MDPQAVDYGTGGQISMAAAVFVQREHSLICIKELSFDYCFFVASRSVAGRTKEKML
jgi:hypothetical protein